MKVSIYILATLLFLVAQAVHPPLNSNTDSNAYFDALHVDTSICIHYASSVCNNPTFYIYKALSSLFPVPLVRILSLIPYTLAASFYFTIVARLLKTSKYKRLNAFYRQIPYALPKFLLFVPSILFLVSPGKEFWQACLLLSLLVVLFPKKKTFPLSFRLLNLLIILILSPISHSYFNYVLLSSAALFFMLSIPIPSTNVRRAIAVLLVITLLLSFHALSSTFLPSGQVNTLESLSVSAPTSNTDLLHTPSFRSPFFTYLNYIIPLSLSGLGSISYLVALPSILIFGVFIASRIPRYIMLFFVPGSRTRVLLLLYTLLLIPPVFFAFGTYNAGTAIRHLSISLPVALLVCVEEKSLLESA